MGRIEITTENPSPASWKSLLPGAVISAISLAIVFTIADWGQFAQALRLANYRFVGLFLCSTMLWLFMRALLWHALLEGNFHLKEVFLAINQGYLLNNILPFRLGEMGRAYLLSAKPSNHLNQEKLGFFYVFSTILIERALDIAFATSILLVSLGFVAGAGWALKAAVVAAALVIFGLGGLYWLAHHQDWARAFFHRSTRKIQFLQKTGARQFDTFLSGLSVLTRGRSFLKATGFMALNWAIAIGQYYLLMLAFFPQAKVLWAAFSLGVFALGIAAPSSPGAIGVMELSLVGALSLFKLDPSTSLALAITAHLTNYLITGAIGAYALAREGQTLTQLYQRIRQLSLQRNS